jgi:hypothetical protein
VTCRCKLECHAQTPRAPGIEVTVAIHVEEPDVIVVCYRIIGDVEGVRVPGPGTQLEPERLWEHTCCEMFVASSVSDAYVEWNFSPTGQIARFEFSSYRCRRPSSSAIDAQVSVTVERGELRVEARVPLRADVVGDSARLALTTVIEDVEGRLSYWAMRHPSDRPDFHHRDGFALALTHNRSWTVVDDAVELP